MLKNPSAKELMEVVAVAGLAQNFAALRSLTTTGIQDGHMKMHLNNILNQFEANDDERILIENTSNTIRYRIVQLLTTLTI
jgi:hydroxymethylglutaryl-CoA reductase